MSGSGRYESRLFNYVVRQSLKWGDRYGQVLRNAQQAVVWGVQVALYPIYATFQGGRLARRELKQTVRRIWPKLKAAEQVIHPSQPAQPPEPLTADTPILRTLAAVQSLPGLSVVGALAAGKEATHAAITDSSITDSLALVLSPAGLAVPVATPELGLAPTSASGISLSGLTTSGFTIEPFSSTLTAAPDSTKAIVVQGVASLLETRQLVLVTIANEILNILTSAQQVQLQQRISWELAGYWRDRRLQAVQQAALRGNFTVSTFLTPPADRPTLLPPVRWFRGLIRWVQTGPVAIATNLFQESALQPSAELLELAELAELTDLWSGGASASADWLTMEDLFGGLTPDAATTWPALQSAPASTKAKLSGIPPLSALPAAMASPASGTQAVFMASGAASGANSGALVEPHSNPSQSMGLLQRGAQALQRWIKPFLKAPTPAVSTSAGKMTVSAPGHLDRKISTPSRGSLPLVPPNLLPPNLVSTLTTVFSQPPDSTPDPDPAAEALTTVQSQDSELTNTWIEIEATFVGYEKHPLERLLEWLDRGMLWFEDWLMKLWNWLQQRRKP